MARAEATVSHLSLTHNDVSDGVYLPHFNALQGNLQHHISR